MAQRRKTANALHAQIATGIVKPRNRPRSPRTLGRGTVSLLNTDRGVQYRAIRYTDRLADAEAVASVGSKGDSYDCQSLAAWFRKNRVVLAGTV